MNFFIQGQLLYLVPHGADDQGAGKVMHLQAEMSVELLVVADTFRIHAENATCSGTPWHRRSGTTTNINGHFSLQVHKPFRHPGHQLRGVRDTTAVPGWKKFIQHRFKAAVQKAWMT